jgi:transposase
MTNILKAHLRATVETLIKRGESQRKIARITGIDQKTIRRYVQQRDSQVSVTPPQSDAVSAPAATPKLAPKRARSACASHRTWIEEQVKLGRNAQSIYQDLVESRGFTNKYNAVKRFVRVLKVRDPEQFDVL